MITTLSRVMDDPVGSFPSWAEFPLGRVFGFRGDFVQDKVPYIKSPEFHSLVVVLSRLSLILHHSVRSTVSDLVQAIQVDPQLIDVAFFVERLSSDVGDSNLNQDYCLGAISEFEGGFSCQGSGCNPVKTLGNSFGHAPLASSNLALMILSSVRLVISICPFAYRCPGDEN